MAKTISNLIEESGMLPHLKTLDILRENDWSVLVSPYYHDTLSDSIRETDLIAEKQFLSADRYSQSSIQINLQLFIECKYIKHEVAFWFDKMDVNRAVEAMEQETKLKIVHGDTRNGDILPSSLHQLKNDVVAKLFSTNSNKEDVIYKAMNQCLHSQINYRRTGKKPIFKPFYKHRDVISHIIQYPVIVCDNFKNLLEAKVEKNSNFSVEKLTNHFVLETNYREDYYLIDLVDIDYLENFLKTLEEEARRVVAVYGDKQR